MTKSEQIVSMLAKQLNKKMEEMTPEKRIKEDLKADSLDIVDLVMSIEEKYKISVPDEAAEAIKTVGDLIKFAETIDK